MSEPPRRRILSLKRPPQATAKSEPRVWRCKPCGALVEVAVDAAPESIVRCTTCNARLGRAELFLADPPGRVRARLASNAPPATVEFGSPVSPPSGASRRGRAGGK